jgi:hypothetical protein
VELGHLLTAGGVEQLVDGVPGVHRDDRQHRLAAEQVLVRDVVLEDLVGLVEVAVLAGRELQLRDPEDHDDGDGDADEDDDNGVLAQQDGEPGPEPLHRDPSVRPPDVLARPYCTFTRRRVAAGRQPAGSALRASPN